jgi:hypothetical protein
MTRAKTADENSKFEIRNPKQIQMIKNVQCSKPNFRTMGIAALDPSYELPSWLRAAIGRISHANVGAGLKPAPCIAQNTR